jgi:hypothetical protein
MASEPINIFVIALIVSGIVIWLCSGNREGFGREI